MNPTRQRYRTTVLTRTFNGKPMSTGLAVLMYGAEGVDESVVLRRIHRLNWSFERAVTTPIGLPHRPKRITP